MSIKTVTITGNKQPSEKFKDMLVDLRNSTVSYFEQIENIRKQGHSEGFVDHEINLLIKHYLKDSLQLNKDQIKYILHDKARRAEKKRFLEQQGTSPRKDVPQIPAPDYKIVVPDQVIEQEQAQLKQQQEQTEEYKPDYALEDYRLQIETYKSQVEELTADKKNLEEKYKQLEAKTRTSSSNYIPAAQGNNLRTKVVVAQIFREVLALKGSRVIYANVVMDISQNKYVKLEPLWIPRI